MNLDAIIAWVWENKEIIGLFAVVATAIGALYRPMLDLLQFLPRALWCTAFEKTRLVRNLNANLGVHNRLVIRIG